MIRKCVFFLSLGIIAIALLFIKVYSQARHEVGLGDEAYDKGDYHGAILHYERAIKWYTPWNRGLRLAVERLWQIGGMAEKQENTAMALAAYRALRSSLYAVQSLYIPYPDWISKSEDKIATLMAVADDLNKEVQGQQKYNDSYFKTLLQREKGLHVGWVIVVEVGFIGWVSSVMGLIWCIRDKDGFWSWRQGVMWGSAIFIFFTAWLMGMLFA